MIFSMNSQDLLEGLNTVSRALAARPSKQILEGILLSADQDRVTMTGSDGSLVIEYTTEASIEQSGQTVMPGRIFNDLIRKLPAGAVRVEVQDERTAVIRCQKNRSTLAVMNAAEYPETRRFAGGCEVKIPQKKLREMINRVSFAIATDENRQILTGALLEVSRAEARLVALDGFRLAMQKAFQPFQLPDGMDVLKAIIPGKVLNELSKILQDDESFCTMRIDQGKMQCLFGNISLSSVLMVGEYVDYRRILPASFKTEVRADRSTVLDAIDRASLMAREGKNNLIRMSFRENSVKIASNAEMGAIEEEAEASLVGEPIDIAFNARYLIDVIRNVAGDELCMKFNSSVSPCVVVPRSGDEFIYLILPVRVFQ